MAAVTQVRILVTAVTFLLNSYKHMSERLVTVSFLEYVSVSGIVVSIAAFQAVDPGSIPG